MADVPGSGGGEAAVPADLPRRLRRAFDRLAEASTSAEDFNVLLATLWHRLHEIGEPDMADAWLAFVGDRLGDVAAAQAVDARGDGVPERAETVHGSPPRRPFLRGPGPGALPRTPSGWDAYPVKVSNHDEMELVYDPRRHDVLVTNRYSLDERLREELSAGGWGPLHTRGPVTLWTRERVDRARSALDGAGQRPGGPAPATGLGTAR